MMSKTIFRSGIAIGCALASAIPSCALAQVEDGSFDFAVKRTPTWTLTATTNVNWHGNLGDQLPTVARVECRGEGRQFNFTVGGSGELQRLRISFLGVADDDGERDEITALGDHLWLYVDGERWEYANIEFRSDQFSNLRYPQSQLTGDDIVTADWRGYQAVREAADQPWQNLSRIYERLILAKKIEWSFKSRDWTVVDKSIADNRLPKGWETTRYLIENAGLQHALSWCTQQVSSQAAHTLPDEIREKMSSEPAP